jgi:hypothetical protein
MQRRKKSSEGSEKVSALKHAVSETCDALVPLNKVFKLLYFTLERSRGNKVIRNWIPAIIPANNYCVLTPFGNTNGNGLFGESFAERKQTAQNKASRKVES